MVHRKRVGDALQEHCLACAGRADDEPALAFSDGGHEVHDPGREVLGLAFYFETDALVGIERYQVVEQDLVPGDLRRLHVYVFHLQKGEIALALFRGADLAADGVAGAQVEAPYLGGGDIDVVRAGQVVVVRRAQEAETVGQNLQDALAVDGPVPFGLGGEQGEDEILAPHAGRTIDGKFLGQGVQLGNGLFLQLNDVHASALGVGRILLAVIVLSPGLAFGALSGLFGLLFHLACFYL